MSATGGGAGPGPGALVRQAQVLVSVQAECSMDAALALMQSIADATDETLGVIAEQVVHGRVRFDPTVE